MSRRGLAISVVVGVLLLVGILWFVRPTDNTDAVMPTGVVDSETLVEGGSPVRLFFPGGDALLHMEERVVKVEPPVESAGGFVGTPDENQALLRVALAGEVIRAVLGEPEQEGLRRAFDEGTGLADVRLTSGGIAIVSLQPAPGSVNRGLGSRAELLRVYGLVDSVVYSVPGVESVMILWAGSQPHTLAGHVDTSRPLFASLDWVARESRSALEAVRSAQAVAESK